VLDTRGAPGARGVPGARGKLVERGVLDARGALDARGVLDARGALDAKGALDARSVLDARDALDTSDATDHSLACESVGSSSESRRDLRSLSGGVRVEDEGLRSPERSRRMYSGSGPSASSQASRSLTGTLSGSGG
jgi:hypothetical protein